MKMKSNLKQSIILSFVFCLLFFSLNAQKKDLKMDSFVNNLLSKMTLDEKLGQLNLPSVGDFTTGQASNSNIAKRIENGQVGGVFNIKTVKKIKELQKLALEKSRLKIPLIFAMDVIHGYETTFPIPLGLSCTWDMKMIERTAQIAAQEATADGINWTFSPMVDIARDPRWGRIAEGSGEDPFLGSEIAKAMVYGYQGNDLSKKNTMMACVKHFALYGASEAGRDYNTVDMSHLRMYNEYFPPYKAAIEAGAGTVMASFNEVDGIPATGSKWLMTEVLRNQWNFNGFVVTDYTGVNEMIEHGVGDLHEVSALAKNAGIDMDMVGEGFLTTLKKSIDEGIVSIQTINQSVRLILEAKYKLGLFDDPYRYNDENRPKNEIFTASHRAEARKIASNSFVLMKNENQVLPLKKSGTIALIGPLADSQSNMPGTWAVAANYKGAISLRKGLEETVGDNVKILYAKGSNLDYNAEFEKNASMFDKDLKRDNRPSQEIINEAVEIAKQSDVVLAALGESSEMNGECSSRTNIDIPQAQKDLLEALVKTGKPVVLVLFTGRPLTLIEENEKASAILNVWFPGTEAGHAISDVLFGDVNPSGKLTTTFPRSLGQIPLNYNHKNTGRPLGKENTEKCKFQKFLSNYLDECNLPLFPFGFGLSYTSFQYSDISLSSTKLKGNLTLKASITLTNTGKYDGAEVVQLYIRDLVGSITRPVKELKGFQKIYLKAGESKTITFEITPELLKFYNSDLKYDWEGGEFEIMIGTNSAEVKSKNVNWIK